MMTLRQISHGLETIPVSTSWYLSDLGEFKGRQDLFTKQSPQRLETLREHALIESAIQAMQKEFTLSDLEQACPGISREMVRRVLRMWKKEGKVECLGRGPGALWEKRGITPKRG